MSLSNRKPLIWTASIVILVLGFLAQIAYIWLKASDETDDAFQTGRRLTIDLLDDQIYGKIIQSDGSEAVFRSKKSVHSENNSEEKKEDESTDPAPSTPEKAIEEEKKEEPAAEIVSEQKAATEPEPEIISTIDTIVEEKEAELPLLSPSSNPPAEFSSSVSEKTEFGSLPKIDSKGTKPWKYYSKNITLKDTKKPMIALVVAGLGQNRYVSELALRLPEEVTLSFSPYAKDLNSWLLSARIAGHEVLIDLPMEASNYPVTDPGPLGLLVSKDQAENEIKIKKLMAQNAGYLGFLTPKDEVFLQNNDLFKSLLNVFAARGLMVVVGKQPAKNETREMIEQGNTASIIIDNIIDEELVPSSLEARLALLEQTAKQRGYAVGITGAYPITIKHLKEWMAKANENGFVLVPISTLVSKRF